MLLMGQVRVGMGQGGEQLTRQGSWLNWCCSKVVVQGKELNGGGGVMGMGSDSLGPVVIVAAVAHAIKMAATFKSVCEH